MGGFYAGMPGQSPVLTASEQRKKWEEDQRRAAEEDLQYRQMVASRLPPQLRGNIGMPSVLEGTPSTTLGGEAGVQPPLKAGPPPEIGKIAPVFEPPTLPQAAAQTSLAGQVPKGDFEKFVRSRQGKPDERFPQLPSDPTQTTDFNRWLDERSLQQGQFDLQRARLEQGRQAAEINPQTREGAELGVLTAQAELMGRQGELAGAQAGHLGESPLEQIMPQTGVPLIEAMMNPSNPHFAALNPMLQGMEDQVFAAQHDAALKAGMPYPKSKELLDPASRRALRMQAAMALATQVYNPLQMAYARTGMPMQMPWTQ